jgi:hypothetical protein
VLVEGPAGIGKSAARTQARDAGFRVLSAAGGELETDFPYGVVRQLFEPELAGEPEAGSLRQALQHWRGRCSQSRRHLGRAQETVTAATRCTGSTG